MEEAAGVDEGQILKIQEGHNKHKRLDAHKARGNRRMLKEHRKLDLNAETGQCVMFRMQKDFAVCKGHEAVLLLTSGIMKVIQQYDWSTADTSIV